MKTQKAVGITFHSVIIFLSICFFACEDQVNIPLYIVDLDSIKVWDYSESHYLLDTVYTESFIDYYNSDFVISGHTDSLAVDEQSFEVWVQTDVTTIGYRKAGLHIELPAIPAMGEYNDSFKVPTHEYGIRNFGLVRKLQTGEYMLNNYAGYISLKISVPDNYFAGVAYKRNRTGEQFGTISTDSTVGTPDTLVLKMVKVESLIPLYRIAWELKLKNIYQLSKKNIISNGFDFQVLYHYQGAYQYYLPGISATLLSILGLDRFTNGASGGPNGKFDYIEMYTIDSQNGWIIFPTLKPFVTKMSEYNQNGQTIDSSYWYPEIYTKLKNESKLSPNAVRYIFWTYISQ